MNISKSLFKNLSRCRNFAGIYDMYVYKNGHHIKNIEGEDIDYLKETQGLEDDLFQDQTDKEREFFAAMYEDSSGESLLEIESEQLKALSPYFTKLEIVTAEFLKKKFGGSFIYGDTIDKQKKFSFKDEDNEYYCYLDIYNEINQQINVIEVKGTTSRKFDELKVALTQKDYLDPDKRIFFSKDGIMYLKEELDSNLLKNEGYKKCRNKLFDRYSDAGKYIFDIAVERYIVENSLKEQHKEYLMEHMKFYLALLNHKYILPYEIDADSLDYPTSIDGEEIVTLVDVTKLTEEYMSTIDDMRKFIVESINERCIHKLAVGKCCENKKTTECKFKKVCFRNALIDGSILEYVYPYTFNKQEKWSVFDMINMGYNSILDVEDDYIFHNKHSIQKRCLQNNEVYMNKQIIKSYLKDIKYPIYHLDFESFNCPLPRFKGEKPYMQSVFQFSLHIEKAYHQCDRDKDHISFLAKDHSDNRKALCEAMIKYIDLSKGGTVLVYNESFEKTRLKELADIFPEYSEELLNIRDHVFDLYMVFKNNKNVFNAHFPHPEEFGLTKDHETLFNYYNSKMHGSFSIKKMLPIFTNLSYKDLTVGNGTQAVLTYSLLPTLSPSEYNRLYLALEDYCKQDTWSMVEILWALIEQINE